MAFGSIQGQNGFLDKYGDTMLGTLNMNNQRLTGLPTPVNDSDAVPKSFISGGSSGNANGLITYKKTINLSGNMGDTTFIPSGTDIMGNGLIVQWNITNIVKSSASISATLSYVLRLGAPGTNTQFTFPVYHFERQNSFSGKLSNSIFVPFIYSQYFSDTPGTPGVNITQSPYAANAILVARITSQGFIQQGVDLNSSNISGNGFKARSNFTIAQVATNYFPTVKGTMTFGIINFGNLL